MAGNEIKTVDPEEIKRLLEGTQNQELVDELFEFGQLLLDEVQQRTAQLDTKLISLLGWTAAILAFLLVGDASWLESAYRSPATAILMLLATFCSICAVVCSFLGVKTAVFRSPSESDWFQTDLFDNVLDLKKQHLRSMLDAHQSSNQINAQKGNRAREAQWFLAASALLVGVITLVKLWPHLCSAACDLHICT